MTLTSGNPPKREQIQYDLQNGETSKSENEMKKRNECCSEIDVENHDVSVKFPFWGFGVFKRYDDDDYDNQL